MKKIIFLSLIALFFFGCGTAAQRSEFWQHDTMYENWDHMKYSWSGYQNPTSESLRKTKEQKWWGIPTPE